MRIDRRLTSATSAILRRLPGPTLLGLALASATPALASEAPCQLFSGPPPMSELAALDSVVRVRILDPATEVRVVRMLNGLGAIYRAETPDEDAGGLSSDKVKVLMKLRAQLPGSEGKKLLCGPNLLAPLRGTVCRLEVNAPRGVERELTLEFLGGGKIKVALMQYSKILPPRQLREIHFHAPTQTAVRLDDYEPSEAAKEKYEQERAAKGPSTCEL